jgi:ribonuclease HII
VGYSTPEHRAAIRRIGVSPLHRLSFQSMAYQQLELGESVPPVPAA